MPYKRNGEHEKANTHGFHFVCVLKMSLPPLYFSSTPCLRKQILFVVFHFPDLAFSWVQIVRINPLSCVSMLVQTPMCGMVKKHFKSICLLWWQSNNEHTFLNWINDYDNIVISVIIKKYSVPVLRYIKNLHTKDLNTHVRFVVKWHSG